MTVMSDVFPELCTDRFRLRKIVRSDLNAVFQGLSDPRVNAHYGVTCDTVQAAKHQMDWFEEIFRKGTGIWWGVCLPENSGALLGACGFNDWCAAHRRAELGFWLLPDYWHMGIMRECVSALLAHAFDRLYIHRIEAEVEPNNNAASRLLEALGFRLEGIRRECEIKNGSFLDLKSYARLSTDSVAKQI